MIVIPFIISVSDLDIRFNKLNFLFIHLFSPRQHRTNRQALNTFRLPQRKRGNRMSLFVYNPFTGNLFFQVLESLI